MCKRILGIAVFVSLACSHVHAGDTNIAVKSKALAHYIMAVAYDFNGRSVEAISEYERSVDLNPKEILPHLRLAAYYLRLGLTEKSITQLKEVLKLDSQNAQAHYLLGLLYSTQKKYDLAAAEYEQILKAAAETDRGNLEIYTYLAQLYFSQAKFAQAIVQFEHIIKINPKNASAHFFLGTCYLETNARVKSRASFQQALAIEPAHDGALNALAFMYAEDGVSLDDALSMARKAVSIDGANGAYHDTLGWVLHKKGMNAEALVALQKAAVYAQEPVVFEHLGDVYHDVNEFALACKHWKKSLELDPKQPQVKRKLQELEKTQALKK